jgi:hypothetical protein
VIEELHNVLIDVVLGLWQGSLRFFLFVLNFLHWRFGVRLATFLGVRFSSSGWFLGIFGV